MMSEEQNTKYVKRVACPICSRIDSHGHSPDGSVRELEGCSPTDEFQYVFIDEISTSNLSLAELTTELEEIRTKMEKRNFELLLQPVKRSEG